MLTCGKAPKTQQVAGDKHTAKKQWTLLWYQTGANFNSSNNLLT